MCASAADPSESISKSLNSNPGATVRPRKPYSPRGLAACHTQRGPCTSDERANCLSQAPLDVRRVGHQSRRPPVVLLIEVPGLIGRDPVLAMLPLNEQKINRRQCATQ